MVNTNTQLLEYPIPPLLSVHHENPDCFISGTKRAIRDPTGKILNIKKTKKSKLNKKIIIIKSKQNNLKKLKNLNLVDIDIDICQICRYTGCFFNWYPLKS